MISKDLRKPRRRDVATQLHLDLNRARLSRKRKV
jgi:hypothetical protein